MTKRPFRIILAAEAISSLGSQITIIALPLTAVLFLQATPLQMGLLSSAGRLPGVLFGLFAGVVIDRLPKRRVLLAANLLSALVLAVVPFSKTLQILSFKVLLGVSFIATSIASAEGIALLSFIPSIVAKDRLAQANGRFSVLQSTTQIAGPAVAGLLIAVFSAPGAISFDAISFLFAMALMLTLPSSSVSSLKQLEQESTLASFRAGFSFIVKNVTLRLIVVIAIFLNFFGSAFAALQALFIVKHLGIKPSFYGTALAVGGVGAVLGGMLSGSLAQKLSLVTLLSIAIGVFVLADGCVCALHGSSTDVTIIFAVCRMINGFGSALISVALMTYVQKTTPPAMLARVFGGLFTTMGASTPLGALAGGVIGEIIGIRQTLIIATLGYFFVLVGVVTISRRALNMTDVAR